MRVALPGASHNRIWVLEDVGPVWGGKPVGGQVILAEICADWVEGEACVLSLHPQADRNQVEEMLSHYWPSLAIVWPEDVTVITQKEAP